MVIPLVSTGVNKDYVLFFETRLLPCPQQCNKFHPTLYFTSSTKRTPQTSESWPILMLFTWCLFHFLLKDHLRLGKTRSSDYLYYCNPNIYSSQYLVTYPLNHFSTSLLSFSVIMHVQLLWRRQVLLPKSGKEIYQQPPIYILQLQPSTMSEKCASFLIRY